MIGGAGRVPPRIPAVLCRLMQASLRTEQALAGQRSPIAGRIIGTLLVVGVFVAVFAAVAPLRRLARDYGKRLGRLYEPSTSLFERRSDPGRGSEVLPPLVRAMSEVLAREKIDAYWVRPNMDDNGQLWQRVAEGNWPSVPRSTAHAVFQPMGQSHGPTCRVIPMAKVGYELVVCP